MLDTLFGNGRDLDELQMAARAIGMFFLLLVLLRISGMRAFSRKSSFDVVIVITLGSVVARVIVGASPALPTILAATTLAVLHRIVAIATATYPNLERLVKGGSHWVYRGGLFNLKRMHRAGISRSDIEQAARKHAKCLDLSEVLEVRLEHSGELTVIEDKVGNLRREQASARTGGRELLPT